MYGQAITPLAISPTNQYGIGLYGVGPYGAHALLHAVSPPLMGPGTSPLAMQFGSPGLWSGQQIGVGETRMTFGMMPHLGQPGIPIGMPNLGQLGQFGQLGQLSPLDPLGHLRQYGQLGQITPSVGGRQVMRIHIPSAVGIVPIDVVI